MIPQGMPYLVERFLPELCDKILFCTFFVEPMYQLPSFLLDST